MENTIPSIARGDCGAELCAYGKRRQPDESPTRMRAINSLLKKDLERAAVSTVRHCRSRKANKKRGSSSLRCSEWRAKTVFQQAVNPPRNKAASIHSATCGRLRISPGGGSVGRANSSESASLSSPALGSLEAAARPAGGLCGSSLNSRGTATMLAPKKSGRQGNACPSIRSQGNSFSFSHQSRGAEKIGMHESRASAPEFPPA
jgi:hypothetical protein